MLGLRGEIVLVSDAESGVTGGRIEQSDSGAWITWYLTLLQNPAQLLGSVPAMRDFYESQLAILVFFSIFFYGLDRKFSRKSNPKERSDNLGHAHVGHSDNVSTLARKYLTAYAIVMGEINFVNDPSLSDSRPKARTGSRARTCTPCTTKSMHFQNEWLPYFL